MNRTFARATVLVLFATTALAACSTMEDRPACAASFPPPGPGSSKTTSGNTTTTRTDTRPAPPQKTATKPQQTSQGTWQRQEPRRVHKSQPTKVYFTNRYGRRYVQYPGYPGYYVIGVYPVTYGAAYGCTPAEVGEPVQDINAE
ncbi:hypothetical protein OG339_48745 (plasmid) [Streptosporangium sp. NBC_01495]|uniref:hypothetical protein n=1 Tax=Streptosporangium sp. NBC_01495 TaxID=2903899 RepID=UPI002E3259D9|nr:hypothetical protein [Streptosporangium sp. NBC_01495]